MKFIETIFKCTWLYKEYNNYKWTSDYECYISKYFFSNYYEQLVIVKYIFTS